MIQSIPFKTGKKEGDCRGGRKEGESRGEGEEEKRKEGGRVKGWSLEQVSLVNKIFNALRVGFLQLVDFPL